jgi:hypothetical protein
MAIRDPEAWAGILEVLESGKIVPPGEWCRIEDLKFYPPKEMGGRWMDEMSEATWDGRLERQQAVWPELLGKVRLKRDGS